MYLFILIKVEAYTIHRYKMHDLTKYIRNKLLFLINIPKRTLLFHYSFSNVLYCVHGIHLRLRSG